MSDLSSLQQKYAELLIAIGVNLQPDQPLLVTAELAHADFVRSVVAMAYQAGARYVHVQWIDTPTDRARLLHSSEDNLDYVPDYEVNRFRQMTDERWARLALVGSEFPDGLADVPPERIRRTSVARRQKVRFYSDAMSANQIQWCVAAVPTAAWAEQIFPDLSPDEAVAELWTLLLQVCRIDQPDPVAAWQAHDATLTKVSDFMAANQVRSVRFVDAQTEADGLPRTDLTVGLTDSPAWVAASSQRPDGVRFLANIPTEEVFTTPHKMRVSGWVRTSKPAFPFERKVEDAYFRFEDGEIIDFSAVVGEDVLAEFFAIPGAKRLGEVSLVDDRSPINQAGIIFFETLFDENAVCHIAFGDAYPGGIEGGDEMEREKLDALGANVSDTHVDFMIGSSTMRVTGICADGSEVAIMEDGRFVDSVHQNKN